ncbi:MAG: hypothetical protein HY093_00180 [Candidatus Liptonbacteria bacterium]|nr:hypothetical protein [Candidatus Liptonbacteria bacterium]
MASLDLTVKTPKNGKISIELDSSKFERLAANFGFFNPDFEKSLDRAEADYRAGRILKIKSLKALRTKR